MHKAISSCCVEVNAQVEKLRRSEHILRKRLKSQTWKAVCSDNKLQPISLYLVCLFSASQHSSAAVSLMSFFFCIIEVFMFNKGLMDHVSFSSQSIFWLDDTLRPNFSHFRAATKSTVRLYKLCRNIYSPLFMPPDNQSYKR